MPVTYVKVGNVPQLPQLRSTTTLRIVALVVLAGGLWTMLALSAHRHGIFDLRVYQGAIASWARDGGSLYGYSVPDTPYGFTYPPFAALVMLPLAFVSWPVAIGLAAVVTIACTAVVLYLLVTPVARRQVWTPEWFAVALAVVLAPIVEPYLETLLFGQINMLLVALVTIDILVLLRRNSRFAGVGIGLAAAIKLTPGIFIVYLLVTKRWRAAIVASATALGATLLAALVAPGATREFWTSALWNTARVGDLDILSNQSIMGAVARWNPPHPSKAVWAIGALAAAVIWFRRVRRAHAAGDELTGFALTGVLGCLMSPVTWIHHLVWLSPAFVLLAEQAFMRWRGWRERANWPLLATAAAAVIVFGTRVIWYFADRYEHSMVAWFFSSFYLYVVIALLLVLPVRDPAVGPGYRSRGTSEKAATVRSA
jgi:alpha-1,2-mannosyltransferase